MASKKCQGGRLTNARYSRPRPYIRPAWTRALTVTLLLAWIASMSGQAHAQATVDEGYLGLGPTLNIGQDDLGAGVSVQGGWGISDSWGLLGHLTFAKQLRDDTPGADALSSALSYELGVYANIDILVIVPWVGLLGGLKHTFSEGSPALTPTVAAVGGLEYRPGRAWSLGLWAGYTLGFEPEGVKAAGAELGLRLAWRFRPGWDL